MASGMDRPGNWRRSSLVRVWRGEAGAKGGSSGASTVNSSVMVGSSSSSFT